MPTSSVVSQGDLAIADHINNVRTDVLSTHTHDGTDGNATIEATAFTGTATYTGASLTFGDEDLLRWGTGGDAVSVLRSTALSADGAFSGVFAGTTDHPGVAANSLIISNVTTDGDILFAVSDGGNSKGLLKLDGANGKVTIHGGDLEVAEALTVTGATTLNGNVTLGNAAADVITINGTIAGANALVFEGATADGYETTLAYTDPTADRTITFPNQSGYIAVLASASTTQIASTPEELNYLNITTLGTSEASKAVTVDANGDLLVPDSDKYKFGAGSDMQLYHDGTNSYITNSQGALKIATETSGIAITIGHTTSETTVADNLTVTGTIAAATGSTIGNLTFANGSITDSGGALDFGNETLTTTGAVDFGAATVDSLSVSDNNITNVGNIALDSISADDTDINISVTDHSATALTIKEGSNAYLIIDTANSSESVSIGTGVSGTAITIGHGTSETTVADNLTVTGNLTVSGTTTTVNSSTLTIGDSLIKLGQAYTGSAYDQGIIFTRGDGSSTNTQNRAVLWDESADEFVFANTNTEAGTTTGNVTLNDLANLHVGGITIDDSVDIEGNIDVNGTTNLDAVDIDGAVQIDSTITVGANDQGYDIIFYGDTASANVTWDTSVDDLILNGAARIVVPDGQLVLGSTAVSSTAAELNLLDNVSGLVQADFTKLAAVDATAAEIDMLDALSRGSIIYGNASGATAILTKGGADTVLTSDGTDISWAAASSGVSLGLVIALS